MIQGEPSVWESGGWEQKLGILNVAHHTLEQAKSFSSDLAALQPYKEAVYASVAAFAEALTEEELDREIEAGGGTMTVAYVLTNALLGNTLAHAGEISALKGVQAATGYPFQLSPADQPCVQARRGNFHRPRRVTMSNFTGFSPDALGLLGALPLGNPSWYAEQKPEVSARLIDPARALVEDLGARLRADLSPTIEAQPKINGSISPLNEDLRFAPDKPPYRDYLMVNFWDGAPKKLAPTVRVRIHPDGIGFGGGAVFDKDTLDRWREAVADDRVGVALEAALAPLRSLPDAEIASEALKRVPAPYDAEHPRSALLRHKMIQARWQEPVPTEFEDERFVDWCAERLMRFDALHHWLIEHVTGANVTGGRHAAASR